MKTTTLSDLFVFLLILTAAIALELILQEDAPMTTDASNNPEENLPPVSKRYVIIEKPSAADYPPDFAERFSGVFDIDSVTAGNCESWAREAYEDYKSATTSCERSELFSRYSRIKDRCEELGR